MKDLKCGKKAANTTRVIAVAPSKCKSTKMLTVLLFVPTTV